MTNNRITGHVRPTRVKVDHEFECYKCKRVETIRTDGEECAHINAPANWIFVVYGGWWGYWVCDRHEIRIEDKAVD